MNLVEKYNLIKDGKETDEFVFNCFKYEILQENPADEYKERFERLYDYPYPINEVDINKKLREDMEDVIKRRIESEEYEQEQKEQRAERGFSDSDCWNINTWFLEIMPQMLQQMRNNLHGFPDNPYVVNRSQALQLPDDEESPKFKEWKETLDRMIFLLKEMGEDTCSWKNEYEEEYFAMLEDFCDKYGLMGEKLKTEEEKEEEKKRDSSRMYFPDDFPELYPEASELRADYQRTEQYIWYYRDRCREEFFNLFSKHFWDLWD